MTERFNLIPKRFRPAVYSTVALAGLAAAACGGAGAKTENGDIPTQPAASATVEAPKVEPTKDPSKVVIYGQEFTLQELQAKYPRLPDMSLIGKSPLPADVKALLDVLIEKKLIPSPESSPLIYINLELGSPPGASPLLPTATYGARESFFGRLAVAYLDDRCNPFPAECRSYLEKWTEFAKRDFPQQFSPASFEIPKSYRDK